MLAPPFIGPEHRAALRDHARSKCGRLSNSPSQDLQAGWTGTTCAMSWTAASTRPTRPSSVLTSRLPFAPACPNGTTGSRQGCRDPTRKCPRTRRLVAGATVEVGRDRFVCRHTARPLQACASHGFPIPSPARFLDDPLLPDRLRRLPCDRRPITGGRSRFCRCAATSGWPRRWDAERCELFGGGAAASD
jgi:hypothetical protein